ncbi:MAG: SsrA-binding protein SmpB [Bdellovibrionales bacterium]|nr:SsrA-binding protein SmpB [Bdellovibrionales bacterium]
MGIKIISHNRKAGFEYTLMEKFEAGLELKGTEIKSLRQGACQLKDSYISFKRDEAYLQNAHISPYKSSSLESNHEPERLRKLLLHRHELHKIKGALQKKGLTCIPTKVYLKDGLAKIEIALAKGKKKWDKREASKKKTVQKEIRKSLKRR